ncbi:MAG TPA: LuxR family transcriptional regulator, partial [Chloroflexaceae bacterium]|nr:LuxR family transcriptional regulator [Chloroflexaceae bacterium]
MAGETPAGALSVPEPAPLPQLLTTKLHMPPARPNLLPRPQLLARLQAGLLGKLILVSAPAGFGKTTLLASWLSGRPKAEARRPGLDVSGSELHPASFIAPPSSVAWLSLDAADSEPARFWSYVVAALGTLQLDYDGAALALLRSHQPPPIEAVLTPLLNALSALTADAVLVLDDYHLIESAAVHRALAFLIEHLPPRLHLVVTTRVDPPLPLSRLRAQRLLTELRAADLRLTAAETAAFLTDLMGLHLSAEQIAGLEDRTEGWIAGLQFAALAMRDRDDLGGFVQAFRGSNRFVVDYLVEEVLARQPPHLQAFLLQTSILDRMCGALCDAVLLGPDDTGTVEGAYSQALLAELERSNLFLVPLDDERHWYRYHHLFADLLRQRLRSGASPAAIAALHDRAGAWFAGRGLGVEAIHHALACASWERAAQLIEEYVWPVMFRGQFATMIDWFRTLPAAVMRVRPTLYVLHAVMLMHTNQLAAAEERLGEAEACLGPDTPEELQRLVRGMAHTTRSTIGFYQGDLARCIAHA